MYLIEKKNRGVKDVLTNALIKLPPPSLRPNGGIFPRESIPEEGGPGHWGMGALHKRSQGSGAKVLPRKL